MVSWMCRRALLNWPTLRSGGVFRLRGATAISQQARAAEGLLGKMSSRSILERGLPRQDVATARFRAAGPGKISPWCVPGRRSVAFFRLMRSRRGLGREKRRFAARFARHVSEMSWFWQDMRAMHPKSPANSRRGMHRAKILPPSAPFRCAGPSNHTQRANLAIPRCFV